MQDRLELRSHFLGAAHDQMVEPATLEEPEQDLGHVLEVLVDVIVDVTLESRLGPAALVVLAGHVVEHVGLLPDLAHPGQEDPGLLPVHQHGAEGLVRLHQGLQRQQVGRETGDPRLVDHADVVIGITAGERDRHLVVQVGVRQLVELDLDAGLLLEVRHRLLDRVALEIGEHAKLHRLPGQRLGRRRRGRLRRPAGGLARCGGRRTWRARGRWRAPRGARREGNARGALKWPEARSIEPPRGHEPTLRRAVARRSSVGMGKSRRRSKSSRSTPSEMTS